MPMIVKHIFIYALLSSLVLHFIGAGFLMFSLAYTVKDVIMNNCHGVNIVLVHCQNILPAFSSQLYYLLKSPSTIMRSEWQRNRNNLLIVVRHFVLGKKKWNVSAKKVFWWWSIKHSCWFVARGNVLHKNVLHTIIINVKYFFLVRFDVFISMACLHVIS